jgi:hypothetical protein
MNRFIVFSALLAVAAAEAEPWYGLYGHGLYGLAHKPVITSVGAQTTYSNGAVTPTNTPAVQIATANHLAAKAGIYAARGYGVPYVHAIGKREAEADPWYGYYGYGYAPVTHPVTSVGGLTTYANGAVVPTDPANLAATHAHLASKGLHYLGKREAEAEAKPWYGLYGHGLYGHGYAGYGYAPIAPVTSSVLGGLTTYANGAVVPTDPNNLAATSAHLASKGLHYIGKREAEAEPWYGLYGHGLYGYAHPYTAGFGCHNTYGAPVPCAGRKKREAEAEADPFLYYPAYPGVTSVGAQTTYSNGAVVPTDLNNLAATAAHLATTYPRPAYGYAGYGLGLWG